jgi:NAD(P)-dependent dehydrogenase (short-subunit alcohol dehydrogenase family)
MVSDPEQKVAVVAGAGSGIGRGCALRLGKMGYHVILVGRTEAKLAASAESIAEGGGSATIFPADVRDWDRLATLRESLEDRGVDLVINCAGGQFFSPSSALSQNGWQSVIDTNLSGSFFLCRQLLSALRRRRGSVVTVIANIWQRPAPGLVHSAAARAGIVSMTRTLALEWAGDGIRLNAVSPGLTDTPALRNYPYTDDVLKTVPLGRMGSVDEVVDAILFIGLAPYITGEVLVIDGGLQLR